MFLNHQRNWNQVNKKPKNLFTVDQYKDYGFVISSSKTIVKYKQIKVGKEERDGTTGLLNKLEGVNVTFHFGTTSRNDRDGIDSLH